MIAAHLQTSRLFSTKTNPINLSQLIKTCIQLCFFSWFLDVRVSPVDGSLLTDPHPLFVYFIGNLAHTKGKGINTMRSLRTPTRTITFAKVLTALSALSLYNLLHVELPLGSFSICSPPSYCHYHCQELLLNYNSSSLVSVVFVVHVLTFNQL